MNKLTQTSTLLFATIAILGGVHRANAVGATVPWTSLEAEAGTLGGGASVVGQQLSPDRYSNPTLEASGHSYVQLTGTGQYVQWTNNTGHSVNAINVRACVPDTSGGGGTTYTLSMYVNGTFRQSITLSSKQTWIYEGTNYQGNDQNPSLGKPHVFYDDMHTFITGAAVNNGDTIRLEKDSGDSASFYYVDVVDIENVAAALTQPAGSLSITDYGAVANSPGTNNYTAIQNCINACQSQGKTMWIPSGTWYFQNQGGLSANGITITGAGPWYSTVYRNTTLPFNGGGLGALWNLTNCHVSNFACDSNATSRASTDGCGGAMDTTGTNWTADNIWTQHVMSGFWASGTGGTISNCRLQSIWADGANINNVSLNNNVGNNITEKNNFVRGTGDDGIAINSVHDNGGAAFPAMTNCSFLNNTVTCAWGGKDIAVYGGSGHIVQNNYAADPARYIGLGVGKFGTNGSDLTGAQILNNTVVRGGGNGFEQGQPAMHIGNGGDGQGVGVVSNVTATGNTIVSSLYDAMGFSTSTAIDYENNIIQNPGRDGVIIAPPFYPAPSGNATIKGNTVTGLLAGRTAYHNNSSGYTVTESGNSWDGGGNPPEGPYLGTPWAIPGTVQAENYDVGGEGVAYHDSDTTNSGGQYRTDGVDVETTSDTGGGYDIGFTNSGEWLKYTVNVSTAGTYTITFRVANGTTSTNTFHLMNSGGTNLTGTVSVGPTGGWQTWANVTANVTLPAGQQVLELYEDTGGYNFNSITFASTQSAPNPPSGLGATAGNGSVALSWTASTGATSYSVYRGTSAGGESATAIGSVNAPTVSYNDTGLTNGTKYYYIVKAFNAAGSSGASNESFATPAGSEGPYQGTAWPIPGTVQAENYDTGGEGVAYHDAEAANQGGQYRTTEGVDVETTSDTGGGYDEGWNMVGEWQRYTVNVSTAGTYTVTFRVANGNTTNGTFHLQNASGTNLSGTVTVTPSGGWQTWKNVTANVTLPAGQQILTVWDDGSNYNLNYMSFALQGGNTAPTAVTLSASAGNTQVTLTWTGGTGTPTPTFNVLRGTSSGTETQIASNVTSPYTNIGLTNGTQYFYKVQAVNSVGTATSNEVSATPAGGAPAAPTNLAATSPSAGHINLTWTAVSGATSYQVFRGTSAGGEGATAIGTPSTNSYADSGLTDGTKYYYTVKSVNASGTSGISNEANAISGAIVSGIDLIVTSVTWSPTSPTSGTHVVFSCVVKNQGQTATAAGTIVGVQFAVDGVTTPITWSDTDTTSLGPGQSVTLTANNGTNSIGYWTAASGSHTVQAWVDDVNRIAESNENNNKTTATISVP